MAAPAKELQKETKTGYISTRITPLRAVCVSKKAKSCKNLESVELLHCGLRGYEISKAKMLSLAYKSSYLHTKRAIFSKLPKKFSISLTNSTQLTKVDEFVQFRKD